MFCRHSTACIFPLMSTCSFDGNAPFFLKGRCNDKETEGTTRIRFVCSLSKGRILSPATRAKAATVCRLCRAAVTFSLCFLLFFLLSSTRSLARSPKAPTSRPRVSGDPFGTRTCGPLFLRGFFFRPGTCLAARPKRKCRFLAQNWSSLLPFVKAFLLCLSIAFLSHVRCSP